MKEIIGNLIGTYEPVTTIYYNADTAQYYDVVGVGVAGIDWLWIGGLIAFLICLFCFFKILGGIMSHG